MHLSPQISKPGYRPALRTFNNVNARYGGGRADVSVSTNRYFDQSISIALRPIATVPVAISGCGLLVQSVVKQV